MQHIFQEEKGRPLSPLQINKIKLIARVIELLRRSKNIIPANYTQENNISKNLFNIYNKKGFRENSIPLPEIQTW